MLREDRGAYAVDVEDDDLLQVYSRMSDGDRPVACRFHGDGAGWVERAVGSGFRHGGSILMSSNRIAIGGGGVRLVPARTPRSGPTVRPDITHGFGREVRRLGTATQPHWSLGVAANMLACQARDHGFESRRDRRRARRLRIVCRTISTALPTFLGLRMGAGERGRFGGRVCYDPMSHRWGIAKAPDDVPGAFYSHRIRCVWPIGPRATGTVGARARQPWEGSVALPGLSQPGSVTLIASSPELFPARRVLNVTGRNFTAATARPAESPL